MFEETPLVMVEDEATFREVVEKLKHAPVIGLDTESDSSYAYQERVCLVQLSDLDHDYIIDPLEVTDLSPLAPLISDPSIVKVLHGADYDIVCLDRDHDLRFKGLFDTLIAAQLLGMDRIGLADLIERFFGIVLDKAYQRHNWRLRPLEHEHIEYARGDTHFLLALHEIMVPRLRRIGRLRHLREECRILQKRQWTQRAFDPDAWQDIKKANELDAAGMRVLRRLYLYRDKQARRLDRPVYKVIPDTVLISLSKERPRNSDDLDGMFKKRSALRRRHGNALLKAIREGLDDDQPQLRTKGKRPTKAPKKTNLRTRLRGRQAERVMASLKQWRNDLVQNNPTLTPYTVASNATLKWIASMRPYNLEELQQVPEVRRWQVRDFGEEILELLEQLAPE